MGKKSYVNEIRIPENYDWVIFIILGCCALYIVMFNWLQRDPSLKNFILQKIDGSSNTFPNWIITSVCHTLLLSALLSQMVPTLPFVVDQFSVLGYSLNKFGFTFLVIGGLYFAKAIITFLFLHSVGAGKRWGRFFFTVTRFYFITSLLLIVANLAHYYYIPDKEFMLQLYVPILLGTVLFKVVFYVFHKNQILPQQWYYKFLYICTLQIAPILIAWRLLFI